MLRSEPGAREGRAPWSLGPGPQPPPWAHRLQSSWTSGWVVRQRSEMHWEGGLKPGCEAFLTPTASSMRGVVGLLGEPCNTDVRSAGRRTCPWSLQRSGRLRSSSHPAAVVSPKHGARRGLSVAECLDCVHRSSLWPLPPRPLVGDNSQLSPQQAPILTASDYGLRPSTCAVPEAQPLPEA